MISEVQSGGTLHGWALTNSYDTFGRRTNFTLNTPSLTQYQFTYDNASRLAAVKDGTYSANYSYLANSPLVSQTVFKQAFSPWLTTIKQYDNLNRLTSISSTHAGPLPTSFAYQYNDANQRTRMTLADGSYWIYQYGSLGDAPVESQRWMELLDDTNEQVVLGSTRMLRLIGLSARSAVPRLIQLLKSSESEKIREKAAAALGSITLLPEAKQIEGILNTERSSSVRDALKESLGLIRLEAEQ